MDGSPAMHVANNNTMLNMESKATGYTEVFSCFRAVKQQHDTTTEIKQEQH